MHSETWVAPMIRLFATAGGLVLERNGEFLAPSHPLELDGVFQSPDPVALINRVLADARAVEPPSHVHAPLQSQEVWAAGVTYLRSRTARMEEAKEAGGGTFYDRVYEADRPELFFKSTPHRVAAPGTPVRIRADGKWNCLLCPHRRSMAIAARRDSSARPTPRPRAAGVTNRSSR